MSLGKKGSLNLSTNAIVMLILAIVVLGLGLAFMRNIFGQATGDFTEIGGEVQKQIITQMKSSSKVVDLSGAVYKIKPGEKKMVYIGFKNTGNEPKKFIIKGVNVNSISGGEDNCGMYDENLILQYKQKATTVQPGATSVLPINIKANSNAEKDSCFYELLIEETDNSLVGYWNFNIEDDATDLSGNNNDGVLVSDPTWTKVDTKPGLGGAYDFDGTNYISLDSIPALTGNTVTISAWVQISSYEGSYETVLTQYGPGYNGYYLFSDLLFKKPSLWVSPTDNQAVSTEALPANEWHHIAGTYDDQTIKIYVDGTMQGSKEASGLIGVDHNAYIGYDDIENQYFNGLIDEVHVFDRALSPSEVMNLHSGYDHSIQLTVNVE